MNRSSLLLILLGALLPGLGPLAANPLVHLPGGDMACTVTVTFHANESKGSAKAAASSSAKFRARQTIEITRVGDLRHDVVTWNDGTTTEMWTQVKTGLTQVEIHSGETILDMSKNDPTRLGLAPALLDFDAASVAWITASTRTPEDASDPDGRPAFHYQTVVEIPRIDLPPLEVTYQAWIDPKTLVPLAFDDGDNLYELTFAKAPPGPLTLPDRFKADLQHYENANATLRHL